MNIIKCVLSQIKKDILNSGPFWKEAAKFILTVTGILFMCIVYAIWMQCVLDSLGDVAIGPFAGIVLVLTLILIIPAAIAASSFYLWNVVETCIRRNR